ALDEVIPTLVFGFGLEKPRAQHGSQRERNDTGDDNRRAERDSKLVEETPDQAAHEEQRSEDGNEGKADGNDGKADLPGSLEGGVHGPFPLFDETKDIFDDDNGVVDDEAHGNGYGHE